MKPENKSSLQRKIRTAIWITIVGLIANGLTAFGLLFELRIVLEHFHTLLPNAMYAWLYQVRTGVAYTQRHYPYMLYGYDWLGFAHILIAIVFIGPLLDPVKNAWVVKFGIIASFLSIIMALVFEPVRGIPFFWSLVDVFVGAVAFIVLIVCSRWIIRLKRNY